MEIVLILAMSANRAIGRDNQLPWHLPADLQHFKRLTLGHHMIMGRKTFESIGKPLPGRTTIIVTRQTDYIAPAGCLLAHGLDEALALCAGREKVFVIGGEEIFRLAMEKAHTVYLTEIDLEVEGDAFFPELPPDEWQALERDDHSDNEPPFAFVTYRRKSR